MIPGPTGLVVMIPTGGDRWVHAQTWDPDTQTLLEFTPERMTEMIRVASGVANLPVQILSTNAFSFAAQVADSFRSDRVFLVGDAAHRMTPRGGAGMNTAIHDAHNLAWKLAFVMRGWAGQGLLDTYEQERRPIGEANTRRSAEPTSTTLDALAIDIGVTYERGALAPEAAWPQAAEQSWQPTGRPGARLPHVWLERDGERRSTLDLLGPGLTVFTGSEGAHWQTRSTGRRRRRRCGHPGAGGRAPRPVRPRRCVRGDLRPRPGWRGRGATRRSHRLALPLEQRSGCRAGAPIRDRFRARGAGGGIRRRGSCVTAPGA